MVALELVQGGDTFICDFNYIHLTMHYALEGTCQL